MEQPKLGERIRYWFDTVMSRGVIALMGLLGLATVALVVVVGAMVWLFKAFPDDAGDGDFLDILWGALMRTLDPGTMGGDVGWGFRLFMLVITIGGLIIVASLIGIVSGAFDERLAQLRKGRSRVLVREHTLILGWNPKVHSIVSELAIANESRGRAAIVILADRDKVEMEDELHALVGTLGRTQVICRSGDPKSLADLRLGSPQWARSVILLAPEGSSDADAEVIKVALALTNGPARPAGAYQVVAELSDPANLQVAEIVGRDEVNWVLGPEVIGRIAIQSCRQSGMSVVYQEFLDFEGDEIYFTAQPSLVGRTFFDAQVAFPDCAAIGLRTAGGETLINPPADRLICTGDQIIVLAPDDSQIELGEPPASIDIECVVGQEARPSVSERTLILGANRVLPLMVAELNEYVTAGSEVVIVAPSGAPDLPELRNLTVHHVSGDPTSRSVLDTLGIAGFDHIVLLADADAHDHEHSDSRTLMTLLHLRDIADRAEINLNIVSEMLTESNRELAEVTRADDVIVSDKLVALVLTQISENGGLAELFAELFTPLGSELYLRPTELYVASGATVSFYSVVEAARRRGETAIGYRVAADAHDGQRAYGVRVNPRKADPISFADGDRVIVLAES